MESRDIKPLQLRGVNAADDAKVERIAESMRRDGWIRRPLLVEEAQNFGFCVWTGSHRAVAAVRAGLQSVPCRVLTRTEADAAFSAAGYEVNGFSCWRDAVTSAEGPFDKHRLAGLLKTGLTEAAAMLQEEIDAVEG